MNMTQATIISRERGEALKLRAGVQALVRRFSISERADVSCCGMTIAQGATLEILLAEGSLRLGALGQRLGISPSTLTRNLARLEERGLVRRETDPADARSSRATLTEAGERAAREVERREEAFAASILGRLPAQRRAAVLEAVDELLLAVRGATESCCPGAFEHLMADFPRETPATERKQP